MIVPDESCPATRYGAKLKSVFGENVANCLASGDIGLPIIAVLSMAKSARIVKSANNDRTSFRSVFLDQERKSNRNGRVTHISFEKSANAKIVPISRASSRVRSDLIYSSAVSPALTRYSVNTFFAC